MIAPGTTLGAYQVLSQLGAGAMGVVYRAKDPRLGRDVAIKVLPPNALQNAEAQSRFLQEARAASALEHENICTIHEVGETADGLSYLVMPCYEGETLQRRIASGPLPLGTALDITGQIASGLQHAHAAGIVHRDVKPANIFVTSRGVVKILDFGLAKLSGAESHTRAGQVIGTLAYMSPEQVHGDPLDHRTDIWALGVVLYEMLAGHPPFHGDSLLSLSRSISLARVPLPIPGRADVSAVLEMVIRRALARERDDRYASIPSLLADLLRVAPTAPFASVTLTTASTPKLLPSIAVLPFSDLSPGKDQDYFCEGMAEELITSLTALEGVRVAARRSSFQFKGHAGDVGEIGRKLSVATVLEGSVRTSGTRLRVTAQLVDASSGYQLWSERYDRELDDVFTVQDEIARCVVDKLRVKLLHDPAEPLVRPHTENMEAYQAYLMGRHARFTRYDLKGAIERFQRAIQIDPSYARAEAALADCYNVLGLYSALPPQIAAERAGAAAERALALEPDLAEAHATLAHSRFLFDWDWAGAEQAFRRSLQLQPESTETRCWYGYFLAATGRPHLGLDEVRKTHDRDPLSAYAASYASVILYVSRRYAEAEAEGQRALELQPGFGVAVNCLALTHAACGRYTDAVADADALVAATGRTGHALQTLGVMLAGAGRQDEARAILAELEERGRTAYVSPICTGDIHAALGDLDAAFACFEQACAMRVPTLHTLRFPSHDALRGDPRWATLVRQMAFPS
jgi:serine/threonine-protein kinase